MDNHVVICFAGVSEVNVAEKNLLNTTHSLPSSTDDVLNEEILKVIKKYKTNQSPAKGKIDRSCG